MIVVVEDAAMVATRELVAVLTAAKRAEAKIILFADGEAGIPDQNNALAHPTGAGNEDVRPDPLLTMNVIGPGGGSKAEGEIEYARVLGNGVNDHVANAERIGGMEDPLGVVAKQRAADPLAARKAIDREAAEPGDRNRVGHVGPEPAGASVTTMPLSASAQ
jgi:hypothetical protein